MNKLRDLFYPPPERLIQQYQMLVELHRKNIGHCCTCKFLTPPPADLPGFVTDYGECKLRKDIFPGKVCGLRDVECDCYEEDMSSVKHYLSEIENLKGAIQKEVKTDN